MRNLLLACLLFQSTISFCQSTSYHPLLENAKTWDVFGGEAGSITPYIQGERYLTEGTALYEGQEYQELWYELFLAENPPVFVPPFDLGSPVPYGLIREDTVARKVYFRRFQFDWSVGEEHLIYDFKLPVGNSIQMADGIWYTLDSVVMTTIDNGESRRKFHFHTSDQAFGPSFYIEGIGGKNGFAYPMGEYFEYRSDLVCVKRSGEILYSAGNYSSPCNFITATHAPVATENIQVSPNPVSQELQLSIQPGDFELAKLYDMNGKMLGSWPVTANESYLKLPVQQIPDGPFWGVLSGKNKLAHFKGIKMR